MRNVFRKVWHQMCISGEVNTQVWDQVVKQILAPLQLLLRRPISQQVWEQTKEDMDDKEEHPKEF